MKKQKLNLRKITVKSFTTAEIKAHVGGDDPLSGFLCSVGICITIDVTACNGLPYCQRFLD